jgi:prephenate dehydrogenase
MTVGIVGLGLMGGSFGLALKEVMPDINVVGYNRNKVNAKEALGLGLVDKIVSFDELKKSDVIILATPVETVIVLLEQLKDVSKDTTIIDLGSTKQKIVQNTPDELKQNLVPAHPMAGTEKFGPSAAFSTLYVDKIVVLCQNENIEDRHFQRAVDIFTAIKMNIVYMDAKEHDIHAAYISHLPHAISYALANSVIKQEDPKAVLALAAGGFRDMSRIARSSPNMWGDIFKQNRQNVLDSIDSFEAELAHAKKLIKDEKYEELKEWMQSATTLHEIL